MGKVVAVDPKKLHVPNLIKHFFTIVLIFSLTHTDYLCCDNAQPPRFHNLTLTICSLYWSNGDLGAGEPPSLGKKTFIEPFRNGNLASKLGKQQKPRFFSFFFFSFKLRKEITCNFSSHLLLILRNIFLWGEKNCLKARGGGMMLPNFGTVVVFLFS